VSSDRTLNTHATRGVRAYNGSISGLTAATFGGVAGIFALFFFSEVPKVKKDIMQKVPIIGDWWRKEIPASDSVRGKNLSKLVRRHADNL